MNGPKPFYDLENGTWKEGGWVAERLRTDKLMPNSYPVVNKILQSIDDGITFTSLLREFERYKQHGKKSVRELYLLPSTVAAAAETAKPAAAAKTLKSAAAAAAAANSDASARTPSVAAPPRR